MRFFHLSDLHLGIKLYEHDLLKDQKAILDEIVAGSISPTPLFSRGIFTIVPCRLSKRLRGLTTS